MNDAEYQYIIVESFRPLVTAGLHGDIHIRPIPGQDPYLPTMHVQCDKIMSDTKVYPLGTRFRIKAKIVHYHTGAKFVSTHYTWPFEVLGLHKD